MSDDRYPDTTYRSGLYSVQCPKCLAPAGRRCINLRTGKTLSSVGHREREKAYTEQHRQNYLARLRASQPKSELPEVNQLVMERDHAEYTYDDEEDTCMWCGDLLDAHEERCDPE